MQTSTSLIGDHPRVCGEHVSVLFSDFGMKGSSRVCGEHLELLVKIGYQLGSSPRMRGTHANRLERCRILGIIPAYAGNTVAIQVQPVVVGDHPRVCGEHVSSSPQRRTPPGSSPRMRGTRGGTQCARISIGIIPAYAGNTLWQCWRCGWSGDHPRVCGEHQ